MADVKRTKATKQQKRYTKPAGKGAYAKMLVATSEIVMRNRGRQYRDGGVEFVLLEFPHWCKFAKDFPKGVIVSQSPLYDVRKINAVKLLDWLFERGYAPYDSAMLVKQTKHFEILNNQIERMFEN